MTGWAGPEEASHPPTFAEMLASLHRAQHTGPVIIHFAQGHPNTVEIPAAPTTIRLDKGRDRR